MPDPLYLDVQEENRLLAEASRRRARFQSMVAAADPIVAARANGFAQSMPGASPDLVQAAAYGGMDEQTFRQVAAVEQETGAEPGWFSRTTSSVADFVSDGVSAVYEQAIKPLIRGTFTIADTLSQELVQRPLTAGLVAMQDPDVGFGEAYDTYGDSAGLNILQGDIDRTAEGGSLGTGFFSGGGAQARSTQERTLMIDGNTANLGRALPTTRLTGELFGYDSTAYNAVAGVSQFAADVLADPAALFLGGSTTLARGAAKAGLVAKGSAAQDVIRGGAMGVRRAARRFDPAQATAILNEADEAGRALAVARPVLADGTDAAQALRESAGLLEANGRRTVLVEKARDFIGKPELLKSIADASAFDLFQSFKRSAANTFDHTLIRRLGAATDESQVSEILLDAIQQGQVTEKGFYTGLSGFRRKVADSKLAGTSARGRISVDDLGDASDKLDSFMRQANVDRDTRASIFQRVIDLDADDVATDERTSRFFDVVDDAMEAVTRNMDGDLQAIKDATRHMRNYHEDLRMYGVDVTADPILTPLYKNKVDPGTGVEIPTVGPQLTSELAKVGMELPDVTAVRRAAKRAANMQRIWKVWGVEPTADAARWVTRDLFKPMAILRPAYVVRIGLEEQLRLAAAGYDSLFTHPARFIMANILARTDEGVASRSARALQALPSGVDAEDFKVNRALTGETWDDTADALSVANRRAYNVMADPVQGRAREFTPISKPVDLDHADAPRYIGAWQHELAQLSAAREARWLAANGGDLDGFVDWARNTAEGRKHVAMIARVSDEAADLLSSDDAVRAWGLSINKRLAAKTGGEVSEDGVIRALGDADLLEAVADGRMSGIRFSDQSKNGMANLHRTLRSKFDLAPQKLKIEREPLEGAKARKGRLDEFVNGLFETFTGNPTTKLARYPAFRQSYIKRAGESMGALADDATRTEFARQIENAFTLTKAEKEDLTAAVARHMGKKGFHTDLTELDEIVKLKAATEVKDLLFDVTKRSNVQDAYEVALPFFDAWKEVTTTWAKLVKDNPAFFVRAQQGYQSLRDSGVVYVNDFDEEVFAYPGGGMLSKFFGNDNASLRLEGRVQGANLVAQGIGPGFGPVVQWATGALMPDTREWQEVRDWMVPFGTGGVESAGDLANPAGLVGSLVPAWAEKGIQALTSGKLDQTQWNSTVGDVLKVLAESGRYNPADPADQRRLIEDAKSGGRWVFALRALTQGVGLTGASATWEIATDVNRSAIPDGWDPQADPDGTWHTIGTLASELHSLAEFYDGDWQSATAKFVEMYGMEPYYLTQAKSRSLAEAPVTTEGDYWMREHAGFADRHTAVAGYFVPPEEDVRLDYGVYRRQMEDGTRQSLTPDQQLALANQAKAKAMYSNVRDQLDAAGIGGQQRTAVLSQARAQLDATIPGWQYDVLGVGGSLSRDQKIDALFTAAMDPDAPDDTPVLQPLRVYLDYRRQALEVARSRGVTTLNNQASADIRAELFRKGFALSQSDPAFRGVWTQLLSSEVEA